MSTTTTPTARTAGVARGRAYERELPPEFDHTEPVLLKRAVIYIRVSTSKQADTDFDPDGLSLPAQRDACLRKAAELGAEVIDEYMDRGESAKTADRPQFQAMIRRITQDRDIDFVILDKINRFARNRRDDANVLFELKKSGAALISVKENIDDTPAGKMMHGILATLAEFESANNGTEALKGMTQKARVGGTPGRAPIGYVNIRLHQQGSKMGIATVEIDAERAPHIRWAFEQYATGEWTTQSLADALEGRGLRTLPVGDRPAKPITKNRVAHILGNRYYIGLVTFRGTQYDGRHEPLIDAALFAQVQAVLKDKAQSGEKTQKHHHYLKGTVFCGECGSRFVFSRNTGRGGTYDYFKCQGQHNGVECAIRYLRADWVEAQVEDAWAQVQATGTELAQLRSGLIEHLGLQHGDARAQLEAATKRRAKLEDERVTLLRAHLAGAVPLDLLKAEQDRITSEMTHAQETIDATGTQFREIETTVTLAINLAEHASIYYLQAGPTVRRRFNQAFFTRVNVHRDGQTTELASPFRELLQLRADAGPKGTHHQRARRGKATKHNPDPSQDRGWNMNDLVGVAGLEPPTSALSERSMSAGAARGE